MFTISPETFLTASPRYKYEYLTHVHFHVTKTILDNVDRHSLNI